MKMNRFVVFCAGAMMLLPAFSRAKNLAITPDNTDLAVSFVDGVLTGKAAEMPKECTDVQLDDAQKAALKQAKFDYMKQKNTLDATVKNSWMDYAFTLGSATSTRDQGVTALTGVKDAMTAAGMAKGEFELKVFFDILRPEQRENALTCVMKMMKQKWMDDLRKKCSQLPPEPKP